MMDDFDREMRADEARFTENNPLTALTEAERKALYKSSDPLQHMQQQTKAPPEMYVVTNEELIGKLRTTAANALDSDIYDVADPLTYLTRSHEVDVLPCERDEKLLAKEYTKEKIVLTAERIVLEDDAINKEVSAPETQRALTVCRDHELDEAYRAQLYELVRAVPPMGKSSVGVEGKPAAGRGPPTATTATAIESALPGPYLTFDTKGRFTRYEAITQRPPAHRSAASIMTRSSAVKLRQRSKHYPAAPGGQRAVSVTAEKVDGRESDTVPQDLQHMSSLYRWQHSMGLTATGIAERPSDHQQP